MVDSIGLKPSASVDRRLAPVTNVTATQPVETVVQERVAPTDGSTLKTLAQAAAQKPVVDHERVAQIRKAIADGKFPLIPSTVADRLLALKMEWRPNDPA